MFCNQIRWNPYSARGNIDASRKRSSTITMLVVWKRSDFETCAVILTQEEYWREQVLGKNWHSFKYLLFFFQLVQHFHRNINDCSYAFTWFTFKEFTYVLILRIYCNLQWFFDCLETADLSSRIIFNQLRHNIIQQF